MSTHADIARIAICEDSSVYADALTAFLERDADLRVVGRCTTAEELLGMLPRMRPDILTMDLELPGISGPDAVKAVMDAHPLPVLVLSAHTPRGSELAAAALGAGALEAQPKGELRLDSADSPAAVAFRRRVKRLARARVAGIRSPGMTGGRRRWPALDGRRPSVVAICASTGGPPALRRILGLLPRDYPLPILIVQHTTSGFTEPLARWLDETVALPVRLAAHGARATPGAWVAPDDAHLVLGGSRRLRLDRHTPGYRHCPSGDMLLRSAAESAGAQAAAVVLTGMGRDGGEGVAAVRAAGGLTIAQDEATSAIYGMPQAAAERGAELILPVNEIGSALLAVAAERPG